MKWYEWLSPRKRSARQHQLEFFKVLSENKDVFHWYILPSSPYIRGSYSTEGDFCPATAFYFLKTGETKSIDKAYTCLAEIFGRFEPWHHTMIMAADSSGTYTDMRNKLLKVTGLEKTV